MPHNKTRNTLARQWELLKYLPTRGAGKTAKELTGMLNDRGFKVSKRQVERDLGELMDSFDIDCNNASIPYGWRWLPDASVDFPGLTLEEALSMRLIEETVRPLLPASLMKSAESRFRQACKKLNSLGKTNKVSRWAKKIRTISPTLPLLPPELNQEILETVQSSLLNEWQLEVEYSSFDDNEVKPLTLHPLAMVQRGPLTYLVATAFTYPDIRLYSLQRIRNAVVTNSRSTRPDDFNLDHYIESGSLHFCDGNTLKLEALIDPDLARILGETPLSKDQNIKMIGNYYNLKTTVQDSWQLRWWILSQANGIEVIKPVKLRKEIIGSLKSALNQYKGY